MSRKRNILILAFAAAVILSGGGSAKADFTFGTPTNLGPIVNSSYMDAVPCISLDGLTLYFGSQRPGGFGSDDIWVATRETTNDEWGTPVNLGSPVNNSSPDWGQSLSADGLSLYFNSNRSGGFGRNDLWITTRPTKEDPWGTPVNLGSTVNTSYRESQPSISADDLSLFFESQRPGGYGGYDLWVTTRETTEDDWATPVNLGPTINSSDSDSWPSFSTDGRVFFFISNRPGGSGNYDLYITSRATTDDDWGTPVNLGPSVNSSYVDSSPSISADGSTLYFTSKRPGGFGEHDIWEVPILPVVDFNGDGIVDAADMCIMIDYWGTDEPSCDIGPTPLGDGIVDVQDLIVLAEHLFEEIPPLE